MCQVKDDHLLKTMLFSIKEDQIKKQTIQWYSATRAYRHFMLKEEPNNPKQTEASLGLHEAMDTPSEDAEVTTTGSGNSDHFQQTVFCSPLINGTTCEERYYSLVPVPWGEGGREEGSAPRSSRGKKE
ncbi:hypothetical protein Y1Q_0013659 [Alligator mississippiensis]|uniref:Uncharacterized protein n=1 Tax=Alligator mississippiensis TaxID=8496 RepID=A0A151P3L0_ALLMI|nr:hypothetical protein Y1Q_0013659 [Alligator mississippiensis]